MRLRLWLALLALGFGGAAATAAEPRDAAPFNSDQRGAIETMIHDYLLHHPDVIIEAMQVAHAKLKSDAATMQRAEIKKHWNELVRDPATPISGDPDADVTLVEFFDYQCPYCKADLPIVQKLLTQDRRLRIAYKDLALLGPDSLTAARAALAAKMQHKYDAFRVVMLNLRGQLSEDTVYVVAKAVGLDIDRLKKDMQAPEIDQQLDANLALAKALNITGTPTFVVGDQVIEGAIDLSGLKILVADARKK